MLELDLTEKVIDNCITYRTVGKKKIYTFFYRFMPHNKFGKQSGSIIKIDKECKSKKEFKEFLENEKGIS